MPDDTAPFADQAMAAAAAAQQGDPTAMLLNAMVERGRLSAEKVQLVQAMMAATPAAEEPEPGVDPALMSEASELLQKAEQRIARLESLLAAVADALGACPDCLGSNPLCAECNGNGFPASRPADKDAFSFFVLPVLHRLKRPGRRSGGVQNGAHAYRGPFTCKPTKLERSDQPCNPS